MTSFFVIMDMNINLDYFSIHDHYYIYFCTFILLRENFVVGRVCQFIGNVDLYKLLIMNGLVDHVDLYKLLIT